MTILAVTIYTILACLKTFYIHSCILHVNVLRISLLQSLELFRNLNYKIRYSKKISRTFPSIRHFDSLW